MTDIPAGAFSPLGLVDRAALAHLKSKKLQTGYSHYDVWLDQHAYAFTVAKMMDEDMLAEVRTAIADALENGTGFDVFKKRLKPYLMSRGWWGEAVMVDPLDEEPKLVQLGSTRRLLTIFQTNVATARAQSKWQRIQFNRKSLPYLRYNASHAHHRRDSHKRYYGLVLPATHPIWQQIFPPNGYGCRCSVSQLTRRQAEKAGISPEPEIEYVRWKTRARAKRCACRATWTRALPTTTPPVRRMCWITPRRNTGGNLPTGSPPTPKTISASGCPAPCLTGCGISPT